MSSNPVPVRVPERQPESVPAPRPDIRPSKAKHTKFVIKVVGQIPV